MMYTQEQLVRYSRQTAIKEIGLAGQEKLTAGRALVIGAGGLGSAALMYLAAAGVGTIGVADYDVVELSNLGRQIVHRTSRLGMPKTASAIETLRDIDPDPLLIPYQTKIAPGNIQEILQGYDIVLDCTDRFENKLLISDACVAAQKPFVHAGVMGTSGQIMTWLPGPWPCLRCLMGDGPEQEETNASFGVLGAAVGVIGSMQALEAIKFLLGRGELLTGRMLHFDGMGMTVSETALPARSPYCRACGTR